MKRENESVERLSKAELSERLDWYERILETIPLPLCVRDRRSKVEFANAAARRLFEDSKGLLLDSSETEFREQMGTHFDQEMDAMVFTRDGQRFQILEEKLQDGGKNCGSVALMQDVTCWQESADLLSALMTDAPIGVFKVVMNEDFDILYANETFYALYGYTRAQMQEEFGNKMLRIVYPDDRQYVQETLYGAIEAGRRSCRFELRVLQRGGGMRWALVQGAFLFEEKNIVFCGYLADITERRQAQEEARINEARCRLALAVADGRIWEYNPATRTISPSKAAAACYALQDGEKDAPASHVTSGLVHPDTAGEYLRTYERLAAGDAVCTWVGKMKHAAGAYVWTKLTLHSVFDSDGAPVRALGVLEDVDEAESARLLYQQELKYRSAVARESLLACEINLSRDAVVDGAATLFLQSGGQKPPQTYGDLCACLAGRMESDEARRRFAACMERGALLAAFAEGTHEARFECRLRRVSGRFVWALVRAHLLEDFASGDVCAFLYASDIDEKKRSELHAEEAARRDTLTQLYTRAAAKEKIEALTADAPQGAALLVDINNFRAINAAFSHSYGNGVLREIGVRLQKCFSEDGVVARWGGDEFFVFLPGETSETALKQRAAQLCALLQIDCAQESQRYRTDVSVGAAVWPEGCAEFAAFCRQVEAALAQAKQQGKNWLVLENAQTAQSVPQEEERAYWEEVWLWENSKDAIYIVDVEAYALLYLNRAARQLIDWNETACAGKRCYELFYGFDTPCDFCGVCEPQEEHLCIRRFHNDFLRRHFILQTKTVHWQERLVRIEKAVDVTDMGCAAELLTAKIKTEVALGHTLRNLPQVERFREGVRHLLESAGSFYGADRAYVVEIDAESALAKVTQEWRDAQAEPWVGVLSGLPIENAQRWLPIFKQNEPLLLEHAADIRALYPQGYRLLCNLDIERLYAVPYTKADGAFGFVGLNNPQKHRGDLALLSFTASLVANELQKSALLEQQDFMIYHDALTGALNRGSYMKYLAECDAEKLRTLGVIVADVNGLKQINRNFGHAQGDQIIARAAGILHSLFPDDKLFRVNGDEFVLLCENVARGTMLSALQTAKRQLRILRDGVTLGYTWADADIDVERLVEHAGELMLIEKRQYYRESDVSGKSHRPMLVRNLKKALAAQEFQVYLQPKISIQSGAIAGAEALVRRIHPRYGLMPPAKFVPMLERERIISYVDFFVFEQVCRTLERWQQNGVRLFPISLNFSRATILETDLFDQMEDIYRRYSVPAEMIEIEITESIGEMERETIADISRKIKGRGFSISLDDFGSKYTSMSMLSIMKFHVLKLDKSLVNNLVDNEESRLVVRHVVDMCKDMRIKSVAEGVESAAQLDILREIGCDYAQGYLFNKPIPLPEFERVYLRLPKQSE